MNEVQAYKQAPFAPESNLPSSINAGSVSIEQQRAIAEAQGQIAVAKRFPRNLTQAHSELMESCSQLTMAEIAFYSVPRAGGAVSGPSIRLAEECARTYGNFEYGHRELSRDDEKSEVEVYAWDKEKNNFSRRQITVFHIRDTKNGPQKLRDQKDIDDKIANVASKQVRSRILALLPKWLVQAAENKCRETLANGGGQITVRDRVLRMVAAFGKFSVTLKHLERIIGHSMDDITPDEIADLQGVFNAIKEGAKISDFFPDDDGATGVALTQQAIAQSQEQSQEKTQPAPDLAAKPNPTRTRTTKAKPEPQVAAAAVAEAKPEPVVEQAAEPVTEAQPEPEQVAAAAEPTPEPAAQPDPAITQEFDNGPQADDYF